MTEVVIDASAFVKLVVAEPGTSRMRELLRAGVGFSAPDYLLTETANVLWKKVRWHGLPPEEALESFREAERYDVMLAPTQDLLADALALACQLQHPLYDALYLLLALHGGRPLATADKQMREAAAALGVRVEWVGAE